RNRKSALECVPKRSNEKKSKALQKSHTAVRKRSRSPIPDGGPAPRIDVMIGKGIAQAARKMESKQATGENEVGSMGLHAGNGTAFSAVAPSERPARAAHRS